MVEEAKATSLRAEELMDLLKADAGGNDVPQSGVIDDKARRRRCALSAALPCTPCRAAWQDACRDAGDRSGDHRTCLLSLTGRPRLLLSSRRGCSWSAEDY